MEGPDKEISGEPADHELLEVELLAFLEPSIVLDT